MSILKVMLAVAILAAAVGIKRCDPPGCDIMTSSEQANNRGCPR